MSRIVEDMKRFIVEEFVQDYPLFSSKTAWRVYTGHKKNERTKKYMRGGANMHHMATACEELFKEGILEIWTKNSNRTVWKFVGRKRKPKYEKTTTNGLSGADEWYRYELFKADIRKKYKSWRQSKNEAI